MKAIRNTALLALAACLHLWAGWLTHAAAQMPYFNEWYQPGNAYVKLNVWSDGLYRVSKADLAAAGVTNLGSLSRANIQLFYRGAEVPVFVQDSVSGALDYFEFIGRRNDGGIDSLLYRQPSGNFAHDPGQQATPESSIFTDTSAYFLTWNNTNTQSLTSIFPNNYTAHPATDHYRYRFYADYLGQTTDYFAGGGGRDDLNFVLNPDYITGEGFVSVEFVPNGSPDQVAHYMATPGWMNTGNPSRVEARIMSTTNMSPHIFAIDIANVDQYRDTTSGINIGTYAFDYNLPLPPSTLIRFHAYGPSGSVVDRQRVTYYAIEYDRSWDLNGGSATRAVQWASTDTTCVKVYGADVDSLGWIYDLTRRERIQGYLDDDTLYFLIPGDSNARTLHLFTDRAAAVPEIVADPALANLSDPANSAEFVIITHRAFANSAQAYAQYRDTNTVNRLTTRIAYIDEIYDEFGYGSHTPWAIKNFCRYAMTAWQGKPKHFMIWGKGRNNARADNRDNYIPTFGNPANDWEYVTNFDYDSTNLTPAAGMGRVSLYNDQQGMEYLAKVIDYEQQPFSSIYKSALLMGGGKTSSEQNLIFYANDSITRPYLEGEPLNAQVFNFQKRNNGFESNTTLTTEQLINQGLGIMHYFGHSAANVFELDLLEPNRYTNWHKYPWMMAFGCTGGNFAEQGQGYGERFILEPLRGGIAYLGNTTLGMITPLKDYAGDLYRVMTQEAYGAAIGDILIGTMEDYGREHNAQVSIVHANHLKQLDLQGDPSIKLKVPFAPDLRIAQPDVYFPDGDPQALAPSFKLGLLLHNDGRTVGDSFVVVVRQQLPNGQLYVHDTLMAQSTNTLDSLEWVLPNPHGFAAAGINTFTVSVDALDSISEISETNNVATVQQLFLGNLATTLFPPKYAIVDQQTLFLQASTFSMNLGWPLYYTFEIDTVSTFDSPFKRRSGRMAGNAAIGEWPIGFDMEANQVYYWRVRLSDHYPEQWISSSYKYVPGTTGWSQGEFPQFTEDVTKGIELDALNREWIFEPNRSELHVIIQSTGKATYFLDVHGSEGEAPSGVLYTGIDQNTLTPLVRETIRGDWQFTVAPSPGGLEVNSVAEMINELRPGDYFLLAASQDPRMANWPDNVLQAFEQVGGTYAELRAIPNGDRLIFFGRKGAAPGTATLIKRPNLVPSNGNPYFDFRQWLVSPGDNGTVASTVIGPSDSWNRLTLDWSALETTAGDTMTFSLHGVRPDGSEVLLLSDLDAGITSLAGIDGDVYRHLRLRAEARDPITRTAPQLAKWEVTHAAAPDLVVEASQGFTITDSLAEGQLLRVRAFVRNITSLPMDSVWVRFALQKRDRSYIELGQKRYGAFAAKENKQIEFAAYTGGIGVEAGDMTLLVEVNPGETVLEQYHFNNLYTHNIHFTTDASGPLVDVTVDGKHLMSGDIVSPNPEILIEVNDDNPYIPVTVSDSTYRIWFGVERTYTSNPLLTIAGNPTFEASPVRMPDNKSRLTFRPGALPDGEYTLAVQAYDVKHNIAGPKPYVVQMNVVNAKAMSEVLPYPNPFSSSCRFVYALTGGELPTRFEIEIYTITGHLVKVVDLAAMGDVHMGRNITQYAWDGTDAYGDPLANGVYLYRVRTEFAGGASVELRDEGITDYFKNGFGKLYLMR